MKVIKRYLIFVMAGYFSGNIADYWIWRISGSQPDGGSLISLILTLFIGAGIYCAIWLRDNEVKNSGDNS